MGDIRDLLRTLATPATSLDVLRQIATGREPAWSEALQVNEKKPHRLGLRGFRNACRSNRLLLSLLRSLLLGCWLGLGLLSWC